MQHSTRPPAIQPTGIFEGLRPGAIVFGVVVDMAASMLGSLLLVAFFAGQQASRDGGASPGEAAQALAASQEFLFASLALGLLCTVLGAFVGARRASCFFVRHGVWIGIGSAVVGLLLYGPAAREEPRPPLWFDLLGFSLLLPAGALGGWLAGLAARRSAT
jgi:hypothetical protein